MRLTEHVAMRLCGLLLLACLSAPSWALGLGELELESALNERFDADISLFDTGGLDSAEIRVSLASSEDFERVGVERFFFLTTLKFDIKQVRGKPVIKVTSTQPISEPYLNFLVEVLWPSGRMLKEYTVLLDPPTFTQAAAPDVVAPSRDSDSGSVAGAIDRGQVNVPSNQAGSRASSRPSSAARTSGVNADGTYGTTNRNDTLWKIASDTLPAADVSVQQNMLALKRLNPQAFINDNINLLKAGYVLRTPSANEARTLSQDEAKQRVVLENEAWRTGRSLPEAGTQIAAADEPTLKAQVDATTAAAPAASTEAGGDGQLRIVAEAGDSAQGSAEADADGLGGAAALEERDRLSRELEELTYKMDRELELAANQVTVKERQLDVKDQEIAELQAQISTMRDEMQRLGEQRGQNQSPASTPEPEAWWQSPMVLGGGLGALVLLSVGGLLFARKRRAEAEAEYYAHEAASEAELATRSEPVMDLAEQETEVAAEPETEPLYAEESLESDWDAAPADADASEEAAFADEEALSSEDNDEMAFTGDDAEPGALDEAQISDVIGESEIYIAYGRYPQAVNLLTGALTQDPDRHDVRCKLLELYAETNDAESFASEMATLNDRCDDADVLSAARDLEGRLQEVAQDVALAGEGAGETAEAPAADTDNGVVDDMELSLDDDEGFDAPTVDLSDASLDNDGGFELEIDDPDLAVEDTATPEFAEADAVASEASEDDGAIDLDFDTEVADAVTDPDVGSGDQLGGDLGIDFDPDRDQDTSVAEEPVEAEAPASNGDSEDQSGMLDLDAILEDNGETSEAAEFDLDSGGDEFDFADSDDGASTKLDLAKAYIDMGDEDGARDILNEVLTEGSETQQKQAQDLLETI